MSLWRFMKSKWQGLVFFAVLLAAILGLNWLDRANRMLPANLTYILVLLLCLGAVYVSILYIHERRGIQKLNHMIESGKLLDFPAPDSVREGLYQQIIDEQARKGEAAIESLESARREETAFLLAWVHRMKTPIAAAHLVMERDRLSPGKKTIESLEEEIDRIAEGVEKVLYYVRQSDFTEDYVIEEITARIHRDRFGEEALPDIHRQAGVVKPGRSLLPCIDRPQVGGFCGGPADFQCTEIHPGGGAHFGQGRRKSQGDRIDGDRYRSRHPAGGPHAGFQP